MPIKVDLVAVFQFQCASSWRKNGLTNSMALRLFLRFQVLSFWFAETSSIFLNFFTTIRHNRKHDEHQKFQFFHFAGRDNP